MFTTRRISTSLLLLLLMLSPTLAQDEKSVGLESSATIVTANANLEKVRFAAPGNIMQMRLEVYATSGDRVFDVEMKRGNVLDWTLQDQAGQRLSDGEYLCVVTVKALTGKISQRTGLIAIGQQQVAMRQAETMRMSAAQTQALGPVEIDSGMTVLEDDKARALTVVAHTGREGELISTRGDLSFRTGDFFSGRDTEQMRLTVDGNLGLGTDKPQAKLDVVGTIRASKGIEFADGTLLTTALATSKKKDDNIVASSTGTQNKVAKWLDTAGSLGDSTLTETQGNVGIGTDAPASLLHLAGPAGVNAITLNTPGNHRYRFQTVSGVPNWGALTLNANYNAGWRLDDPTTNGWFFKLDTRGGNSAGANNGLWLFRVPAGPNPHIDEAPIFGVTNGQAYFAGNLGIGTMGPGYPLTVSGNGSSGANIAAAEFTNGSTDTGIRLRNTTAGGRAWSLFSSGAGSGNGEGRFNIYDANVGRSRFSIDAQGNVGIGPLAPTSNLLFPLNVSGSSPIEPGVVAEFKNSEIGTAIIVHNDAGGGGSAWGISAFSAASSIVPGGFSIVDIGGNANRLSIDNAGRVGIGTIAPGAVLQVRNTPADPGSATFFNNAGAMFATANNSGGSTPAGPEPALVLAREGIASQAFANFARFDLKRYENAGTASRTQLDIGLTHDDLFYEVDNTPTIMSLRSNGDVGIGNTNPQARLDVNGDINARNLPGITFAQGDCPAHSNCIRQIPFATPFTVDTITINVPAPGFVFVTASTGIDQEGEGPVGGNDVEFNLFQCSDATCGGGAYLARTRNRVVAGTLHISWTVAVNAPGPLTLRTNGSNNNLVYSHYFYITTHHLSAVYLPKQY